MQVVLNANKASLVQNTLIKDGVQDLSYSTGLSYPIISKSNNLVNPSIGFTGAPDNNSHTFNIPRSNYNYLGRIKFGFTKKFEIDVTPAVAGELEVPSGGGTVVLPEPAEYSKSEAKAFSIFNIIRNVQFKSNGQPILNMDGEAFKAMVMNSPASFQENASYYSQALTAEDEEPVVVEDPDDIHTCVSYLPLFASWYQSIDKALNTSELDQIEIQVTYKTYVESGLSSALSNFTARFECFKYAPDPETNKKMIMKDFSKPIIMECFNTFTERRPAALSDSSATVFPFTSDVNYPCYKTPIFVAKVTLQMMSTVAPIFQSARSHWQLEARIC
ncbi:hypothetical protein BASA81_018248 [Batrachochytrium salamandrivorans]|nr:hypothetical protein BASA81_018248 [Batrachochytrium salamandrivorans]